MFDDKCDGEAYPLTCGFFSVFIRALIILRRERTHAALTQIRWHQRHSRHLQRTLITSRGRPFYGTTVPTSLMPREELMQYVAQVLDITAKSTRGYDLSCSLSGQLYTDADVYVQIRTLTWSVWLIDKMLVGWLLTCFCWSGWRTVTICWGSFVRKQADGGWWNPFSWGHIQGP